MSEVQGQSTEAVTQTTTQAPSGEAPASGAPSAEATSTNPEAPATGITPAAPTYTPDFKFKAYDKEYEIEELYRSLIKDKETEEKVKQFHSKAYGFDGLKEKHDSLRNEHKSISEKYQNLDQNLKTLSAYVKAGDLGSFFEALNLPREMVFGFVKKELEKLSAPPEQRAQMEEFERIRRENLALKQKNESVMSRYEAETLQTREIELNMALQRPDVAPLAAQMDARLGSGAFKRAVMERGLIAYHTTGQEIPVAQAVQEAIQYWTPFLMAQGQPAPAPQAETPTQSAQPKPALPNVGGRSTSPIKSGPRSIDDLKKLAETIGA